MIKVLMTLPVKIGFDGMSKQVLSYGKYMDKSDVIIDLVSCRGFDPKMKSYVCLLYTSPSPRDRG
mgnify:FL=1